MATPRQTPPDAKICAGLGCDTTFTRYRGQTTQSWLRTRFCPSCAAKRSSSGGKPVGTPNQPEARFSAPRRLDADWRHHAICRGMADNDLFFPVGESGPALLQLAEAKAVCRRCPVVNECLTWALESGQDAGVWGGMSERERRALKQQRTVRQEVRTA